MTELAHQQNMLLTEDIYKFLIDSYKQLSKCEGNKSSSRINAGVLVLPYFIIKFSSNKELDHSFDTNAFHCQLIKSTDIGKLNATLVCSKSPDKIVLFLTVRHCSKFHGIAQLKKVTHDGIEFDWMLRMDYIPEDSSIFIYPNDLKTLNEKEGIKLFLDYVGHLHKDRENSSTLESQKFVSTSSISLSKSQLEQDENQQKMQTKPNLHLQQQVTFVNFIFILK